MIKAIVSTDLDGTLLDHHTYDWKAALPAIQALGEQNIPIVFNTSKTFEEAIKLQKAVGIEGPVIVENGSALAIPESCISEYPKIEALPTFKKDGFTLAVFGEKRENILKFIAQQLEEFPGVIEGYHHWSIEDICKHTGLSKEDAELSSAKQFSEPFHWHGTEDQLNIIQSRAEEMQLKILKGGRFYHLQGNTTKATPLLWLKKTLSENNQSPYLICLGDNHNDIAMLNVADYPVCVKSPTSDYPPIESNPNTILTNGLGPIGWNEAISAILNKITEDE